MSTLQEISNSDQGWAAERAKYALQVQEAVQTGQLSAGEAKEILNNLITSQDLEQQASDLQLKAALVFGVTQLIRVLA
jgi:polyhydroxyalkanoate synthesis regulator phasin